MHSVEIPLTVTGTKLCGTIDICGYTVEIMLVPFEHPELERNAGRVDYDKQIIYISNHVTKQQRYDTLIHEVEHALLHYSGATVYLSEALGLDLNGDEFEKFEEMLVQILTPHRRMLLPQLNKIKL
jgi:hypothetical protein